MPNLPSVAGSLERIGCLVILCDKAIHMNRICHKINDQRKPLDDVSALKYCEQH